MQKLVWRNSIGDEIDLTSAPYGITNWEGFANTSLNIQSQQVPFQDGGVFLDALIEQRELSVTLAMQDNNNLENRYKYRRELIHILNPKLGEGYLIYTNDFISKKIKCIPQIPLFETHNSNDSGTPKASLAWTACEPYWEDLEETSVTFDISKQPIIINNGDVKAQLKIEFFTDSTKNPQIYNVTTGKFIKYQETLLNNLLINTDVGKKSVTKLKDINFKTINMGNDIKKIIYWQNKIILLNAGGGLYTSEDNGNTWSSFIAGDVLTNISANENFVVAIGYNGIIWVSNNGFDWVKKNGSQNYNLNDLCFSVQRNEWVGVGEENREKGIVIKSTDLTNWQTVLEDSSVHSFWNVIYSETDGKYLIFSEEAEVTSKIYTSEDFTNLNLVYTANSVVFSEYGQIIQNENIFIYIARERNIIIGNGVNTWTEKNFGKSIKAGFYSKTFNKYLLYADNTCYSSVLLNSWIEEETEINNPTTSVCNESTGTIFVCGTKGSINYGYNGIDFESHTLNINNRLNGICSSDDTIIIVGFQVILKSIDGKNFNIIPTQYTLNSVTYSKKEKIFVAVGNNGVIVTSTDGETWTLQNSGTYNNLQDVIYAEERSMFMAVGNSIIITSQNAIIWTNKTMENPTSFLSVIYKNGFIVGTDGSQRLYVSDENAENWIYKNSPVRMKDFIYSEEKDMFIVVGEHGQYCISKDLETWEANTIVDVTLTNINFIREYGLYIIVGGRNIFYSSDLVNWKSQKTEDFMYSSFYFSKEDFVLIIGAYTSIMQSQFNISENVIQNISKDSDMNLNLIVGANQLRINRENGDFICRVTYRQKYIGV